MVHLRTILTAATALLAISATARSEDLPHADRFDEELDALAVKQGIPQPDTLDRAEYQAWKADLTAAQRKKLHRFCTKHAKRYLRTCGGYSALSIPMYPQIVFRDKGKMVFPTDNDIAAWRASLTPAQLKYLAPRCRRAAWVMSRRDAAVGMEDPACQTESTPLVLAFDDAPVQFGRGTFALWPGLPMQLAWPSAHTPWLALDRNGNGLIDDGGELFGSGTMMPNGEFANNGFAALAVFDANHDSIIDARDPIFAQLQTWADDGDQHTQPQELRSVAEFVERIELDYRIERRCATDGSCEVERAGIIWRDSNGESSAGAVIDVHLSH